MQTFGKRQYAHMELDPWAKRKTRKPREAAPAAREHAVPTSRITGYFIALVTVGVIAVASYEFLVLA